MTTTEQKIELPEKLEDLLKSKGLFDDSNINALFTRDEMLQKINSYLDILFGPPELDPELAGFYRPRNTSEEMNIFLGNPSGTKLSLVAMTKKINSYIKENNLINPENKRLIIVDETLKKLLHIPEDKIIEYTYFDVQKALKIHYLN